jgi:hypothetical protein
MVFITILYDLGLEMSSETRVKVSGHLGFELPKSLNLDGIPAEHGGCYQTLDAVTYQASLPGYKSHVKQSSRLTRVFAP